LRTVCSFYKIVFIFFFYFFFIFFFYFFILFFFFLLPSCQVKVHMNSGLDLTRIGFFLYARSKLTLYRVRVVPAPRCTLSLIPCPRFFSLWDKIGKSLRWRHSLGTELGQKKLYKSLLWNSKFTFYVPALLAGVRPPRGPIPCGRL
jgi:hypothetical protein